MSRIIDDVSLGLVREPLKQPFGFKGGYLSELWQLVVRIRLDDGTEGIGTGVQSVLWSDAVTFTEHTQTGGNLLMAAVTERALQMLRGQPYTDPVRLQAGYLDALHAYASAITGREELPMTFTLNALVAVDFALWQIQAAVEGHATFDALMADAVTLQHRQPALGKIPLITYNTSEDEIRALLDDGAFVLKIKIGSDPDGKDDRAAMVRWDSERLNAIHSIASDYRTPYTNSGRPMYYLDANGRYDSKERLQQFLAIAESAGLLDHILLIEEPFPETSDIPVHDLPVRIAGDERIHSPEDAIHCIDRLGYTAVALKPIAKTLTQTLAIYKEAQKRGVSCFCADLTVPPLMLDWNMNIAARLEQLPGLKIGVIESNGDENYTDWARLLKMHPAPSSPWLQADRHVYPLDAFYTEAPVLKPAAAYARLLDGSSP